MARATLLVWRSALANQRCAPSLAEDALSGAIASAQQDAVARESANVAGAYAAATGRALSALRVALTGVDGIRAGESFGTPLSEADAMRACHGTISGALRAAFGSVVGVALFPHRPSARLYAAGAVPTALAGAGFGDRGGTPTALPPVLWTLDDRSEAVFVPLNASFVASAVAATATGGPADAVILVHDSMRDARVGSCDRAVVAVAGRTDMTFHANVSHPEGADGVLGAQISSITVCVRDDGGDPLAVVQVRHAPAVAA